MSNIEFKKFRSSFIILWIGQICLLLSLLSFDNRFKFLPIWLGFLQIFSFIGYILIMIALIKLRNVNRQFFLALVTFGFLSGMGLLQTVCKTSTDDFFITWAKGLDWTIAFLRCMIYIYSFLGCHYYFKEMNMSHTKHPKTAAMIFAILFLLERTTVFLMFFAGIRNNVIANQICTFGKLFLLLAIQIYVVVVASMMLVGVNKKRKELMNNEEAK